MRILRLVFGERSLFSPLLGLLKRQAIAKQIRILENRLDKGLQKFNEAIAANRALREQIDTLRRERVVFDEIYRKLENELSGTPSGAFGSLKRPEKA